MVKLIEVKPAKDKEPILIEGTEIEHEGGAVVQATGHKLSFEEMLQKVKPFCESIITNFELSGLKVSAERNLFIVKAAREATLS